MFFGATLLLLAQGPPPPAAPKPLMSVELWVAVGALTAALLGGAVVLYVTDLWRKRQLAPDRDSTESLTSFRAMYDAGELSEEEYAAIRARIAAKVKKEVTAANPSLGAAAPASPEGPANGPNPAGPPGGATDPPPVPPTG